MKIHGNPEEEVTGTSSKKNVPAKSDCAESSIKTILGSTSCKNNKNGKDNKKQKNIKI